MGVSEFLSMSNKDMEIVVVDQTGDEDETTVGYAESKYDGETFANWDIIDGVLYLYLE